MIFIIYKVDLMYIQILSESVRCLEYDENRPCNKTNKKRGPRTNPIFYWEPRKII